MWLTLTWPSWHWERGCKTLSKCLTNWWLEGFQLMKNFVFCFNFLVGVSVSSGSSLVGCATLEKDQYLNSAKQMHPSLQCSFRRFTTPLIPTLSCSPCPVPKHEHDLLLIGWNNAAKQVLSRFLFTICRARCVCVCLTDFFQSTRNVQLWGDVCWSSGI